MLQEELTKSSSSSLEDQLQLFKPERETILTEEDLKNETNPMNNPKISQVIDPNLQKEMEKATMFKLSEIYNENNSKSCTHCKNSRVNSHSYKFIQITSDDAERLINYRNFHQNVFSFTKRENEKSCCKYRRIRLDVTKFKPSNHHKKAKSHWNQFLHGKRSIRHKLTAKEWNCRFEEQIQLDPQKVETQIEELESAFSKLKTKIKDKLAPMLDCGLDPEKFEHAYEKGIVLGKKKAHKVKNFKISIIKLLFYRFKGSFSRKDLSLEEFTQEFSDILESILDELEKVVDSWEEETVNLEVPTFPKFERKNKKLDPVQKENKDNIQELNETKPAGQGESDSSYEEKVPLIKTVTVKIHGLKWKINFYKGEILFKIDFKYSNLSMIASDVADEEKNDFQRYRGLIVTSKKGIRIPEDLKNHQE